MSTSDPNDSVQEPLLDLSSNRRGGHETKCQVHRMVGLVSTHIVFDTVKIVIFGALFPKVLEHLCPDTYDSIISGVTFVGTILLVFTLIGLGSFLDLWQRNKFFVLGVQSLGVLGSMLMVPSYVVIHNTFWRVFVLSSISAISLYTLRVAMVTNLTLLSRFSGSLRTRLSLLCKFSGQGTALVMMTLLRYYTPKEKIIRGIPRELWLCLIVNVSSVLFVFCGLLSPPDQPKPGSSSFFRACVKSFSSVWGTLTDMRKHSTSFNFMVGYACFSAGGQTFSLLAPPFLMKAFNLTLPELIDINLYYHGVNLVGLLCGLTFDKIIPGWELPLLIVQNFLIVSGLAALFACIMSNAGYWWCLCFSLLIGLIIPWNAGVANACMVKLAPDGRKTEFMGFFATFNFLSISLISLVNSRVSRLNNGYRFFPLLLLLSTCPSFYFLFRTVNALKKKEKTASYERVPRVNEAEDLSFTDEP